MTKTVIHTDDLPGWAVVKSKLPGSYLGHLRDAVHPSSDGKGMVSIEDIIMRQHFEAMLTGNVKARDWLLRKIIKDNEAVLEASRKRPQVTIEGVRYFQPLARVLALLGCITVHEPKEDNTTSSTLGCDTTPSTIVFADWFLDDLKQHCPADKLAPVMAWLDAGGEQQPRIRDRDQFD